MKKITVKSDTRTEEYIVFDNLKIHNDALFYHCTDGTSGAISLRTDRQVIIEDYKEERDWFIVCGKVSGVIYAVNKHQFSGKRHIKLLLQPMTETEASKLAKSIDKELNEHRFKGE